MLADKDGHMTALEAWPETLLMMLSFPVVLLVVARVGRAMAPGRLQIPVLLLLLGVLGYVLVRRFAPSWAHPAEIAIFGPINYGILRVVEWDLTRYMRKREPGEP
jgi:hypothetical protein